MLFHNLNGKILTFRHIKEFFLDTHLPGPLTFDQKLTNISIRIGYGVRLKIKETKTRALDTSMMKNIVINMAREETYD